MTRHQDDDVPVHADGVRLLEATTGAELRAPSLPEPLLLDPLALALWDLCDGETTLGDMVSASLRLFDAPPDVVRHDIEHTLDALERAGALVWRGA